MSDAQQSWADNFEPRRPMRAASMRPGGLGPRPRSLPNVPRRLIIIAVGLTGSVLLAATIIWGISRMSTRSVPLIEADGRPFRVRPEIMPPQLTTPALPERAAGRPEQARLAPAPEAPRSEALRQQMAPPPAPVPVAEPAPPEPAAPSRAARTATQPLTTARPVPRTGTQTATPPGTAARAGTPAEANPRAATPPAAGRTHVQLSAAVSEDAAKAEWERLRRRVPELAAHQPRITRLERDGQAALWRLRVGGLADPAAARALCEQVRARGGACNPV